MDARRVRALYDRLVRRGVSPHDAADLSQETWLRARLRGEVFDNDAAWMRWAWLVAWRKHIDAQRAGRRRPLVAEFPEDVLTVVGADEQFATAQRRQLLSDLVATLPPRQRDVLIASWDGQTPAQIAEALRVPVSTVKSRLQRARGTARAECDRHGIRPLVWVAGVVAALCRLRPRLRGTPVVPVAACVAGLAVLSTTGAVGPVQRRSPVPQVLTSASGYAVRDFDAWYGDPARAADSVQRSGAPDQRAPGKRPGTLRGRLASCAELPALGTRACAGGDRRGEPGYHFGVRLPAPLADVTGVDAVTVETKQPMCQGAPEVGSEVLICSRSNEDGGGRS